MIEFFVFYIVLCIFLVVQYCKKENLFNLENYLNFKKNVAIIIVTEILLLFFFIAILVFNN